MFLQHNFCFWVEYIKLILSKHRMFQFHDRAFLSRQITWTGAWFALLIQVLFHVGLRAKVGLVDTSWKRFHVSVCFAASKRRQRSRNYLSNKKLWSRQKTWRRFRFSFKHSIRFGSKKNVFVVVKKLVHFFGGGGGAHDGGGPMLRSIDFLTSLWPINEL